MNTIQATRIKSSQLQDHVEIGATYRHYSGKLYKIIALARSSEDYECMLVVYQALYDCPTFGSDALWARPYTMFVETVYSNGVEQARFEKIEKDKNSLGKNN